MAYYDNLTKNVFDNNLTNIDLIIDNAGYGTDPEYHIAQNITIMISQIYIFTPDTKFFNLMWFFIVFLIFEILALIVLIWRYSKNKNKL